MPCGGGGRGSTRELQPTFHHRPPPPPPSSQPAPRERPIPSELIPAHKALEDKHYQQAENLFTAYLKTHPNNLDAQEGIGDAKLGLHQYQRRDSSTALS